MTGKGMKKTGAGCPSTGPDSLVPIPLPNISLPHIRFPRWTEEETVSRRDARHLDMALNLLGFAGRIAPTLGSELRACRGAFHVAAQ